MNLPSPTQTTEQKENYSSLRRVYLDLPCLSENLCVRYTTIAFGAIGQGFTHEPPPNPQTYIRNISLLTFTSIKNPNLLDTFFGLQAQPLAFQPLSNPVLPNYNIALRTHLQETKRNLIGLDTMFAGPGQGHQQVWELPVQSKFPTELRNFIQELKQNLRSRDTMLGLAGVPLETIQFVVTNTSNYLYYGIGLVITEPALVLPTIEIIKVITRLINEFELGNAMITREIELRRRF